MLAAPRVGRVTITVVLVAATMWAGPPARSADPEVLLVADVGALSDDEQLVLTALQGIVNRAAPRIYLVDLDGGQDYAVDPTSELWLRDAVDGVVERVSDPYDLIERFRDSVRGLVVWDPALPIDTQNVATTMAGLDDLLPVSPLLADVLRQPPYGFDVVKDLRAEHLGSRRQAYEWALHELGPIEQYGLLAWLGGSRNFAHVGQHGLRDLVVARRGFAFEAQPILEADLTIRILDAFPAGTPVYGYPFVDDLVYSTVGFAGHSEAAGVSEISASGKELLPSTDSTNLTVHGSYPPVRQHPPWDDHPRNPAPGTTYVTFVITDGDNLGWDQQRLRAAHWDDPLRGSMPIGVSISPLLATHAPRIYDYYVRTMTPNEVFVAGPSGAGYAYPGLHRDLDGYLARTQPLMDLAGLEAVWILDWGYLASPTPLTTGRYVDALAPSAIFTDYGGWVLPNPPSISLSKGVPVIHAAWGENVSNTVARIRGESFVQRSLGRSSAFVFVALVTSSMGIAQAHEVMDALGPGYEVVRPDHFVGFVKTAYGVPAAATATT